jgi:hypothetical protein
MVYLSTHLEPNQTKLLAASSQYAEHIHNSLLYQHPSDLLSSTLEFPTLEVLRSALNQR